MFSQFIQQGQRLLNGGDGYQPVTTSLDSVVEPVAKPETSTTRPRTSSLASPEEAVLIDENAGILDDLEANNSNGQQERGPAMMQKPSLPIRRLLSQNGNGGTLLGPGIPTSASNAILSVGGFQANGGSAIKQHASDFNLQRLTDISQARMGHLPMLGAPFWACFTYSLVSTSMVLVNKLLLTTYKFKYPMVLLFHQNMMTVNSLYFAKEMGVTTYEPLERGKVMRWLPMDIFFVLMLLTGFYSVELLSVPMITIFKNTNNIFIALGDALVFGNIPSSGVVWTMLLMLLAAVMAALNDLEYTFNGYVWTLGNCLASTCFVLYAQTAIAKTNLSTFGKVYYNNVLSLPLVIVADVLVFHDFARLFNAEREEILTFLTVDFVSLWFVSGLLGFLQSLSSLRAQHLTSPTTYSMVGSLNKIPMTFLGVIIFHTPMTAKSVLYVSLSILAGGLYSYTKAKEDIAARTAKQQQEQHSVAKNQEMIAKTATESYAGSASIEDQLQGAHLRHHTLHQLATQRGKQRSLPSAAVDEAEITRSLPATSTAVTGERSNGASS